MALFCMHYSRDYTSSSRFQEKDLRFLASILAPNSCQESFYRFASDKEELLQLIDRERVFQKVIETASFVNLSPAFYFYTLVRHSLLRANINDSQIAEFIGYVLTERLLQSNMGGGVVAQSNFITSFDYLSLLDQVSGEMKFELLLTAGNEFLVFTGIFPDFLKSRERRKGAPSIRYYEDFASSSYHQAGLHPQAKRSGVSEVLENLSQVMPQARRSLNTMAESFLFLHP